MVAFFHALLYVPIYNLLVFLVGILPGGDVGLAVIIVTLIVKFAVMPLSISALRTQRAMKVLAPELEKIKEQYKDNKELQAKETFAIYKKYNVNPFASLATMLIQLPIIICLYWVFRTVHFPTIDATLLYSFVHVPTAISMLFLGIFEVTGHGLILAIISGIIQLLQALYAIPAPPAAAPGKTLTMQEELGRSMALQARFVLPLIIGFVSYASGAVALYFITSNATSILQELYIRRTGLRAEV